MGIKQLWEELDFHCDQAQVSVVNESFQEAITNTAHGLRVGVDISLWIFQADYEPRQTRRNSALTTIIIKTMRIFSMTALIPLFVFNGPNCPPLKGGKRQRRSTDLLQNNLKKMFSAAGFAWAIAPGEAEAELAWLCAGNRLDAVLTEDVEAMVFGAPRVLRMINFNRSDLAANCYDNCQLSREQLVLLAVFCGGNYAAGIPRCGMKTALKISSLPTSQHLIQAASSLDVDDLPLFIQQWRVNFQTELHEHRSKRVRQLVVPKAFPSARVLRLYLFPVTSAPAIPYIPSWYSAPDLRELARLVSANLDACSTYIGLFQYFDRMVFPGLAIRELLKRHVERGNNLEVDFSLYPVLGPPKTPREDQRYREETHVYVDLLIPPSAILDVAMGGADGGLEEDHQPFTCTGARTVKGWVPRALYEHVLNQPEDTNQGNQADGLSNLAECEE